MVLELTALVVKMFNYVTLTVFKRSLETQMGLDSSNGSLGCTLIKLASNLGEIGLLAHKS